MRPIILATLCLTSPALAQAPAGQPLKLEVGQSVQLDLRNQNTRCDNPELVAIAPGPGDKGTQVTGLKVGKTQCSLGAFTGKGVRVLYDVEVVPATSKK